MADRIEWEAGPSGIHVGRIAGMILFRVQWRTVRNDAYPFELSSTLPYKFKLTHGGTRTVADAKLTAEHLLERFAERIGAIFPPD